MSNVIELARYRARLRPPGAADAAGAITIEWQANGTHAYSISGAYASSRQLAVQALVEVSAQLLVNIGRQEL